MVARNTTTRATAPHEDKSDAFRVGGSQHTQQFANLYFSRLKALAPAAVARARATWGEDLPFVKTLDAEVGETLGVVGTLFADLGGKPDIMKEVTRDILAERPPEAPGGRYGMGDGDTFCLEDDSGRISLSGPGLASPAFPFATGGIIAVRGKLDPDGTLVIDAVCLPGAPPAAPTSVQPAAVAEAEAALGGAGAARPPATHNPADKYVALVSGLQMGGSDMEPLPLLLLSDFLTGQIGSASDLALQARLGSPSPPHLKSERGTVDAGAQWEGNRGERLLTPSQLYPRPCIRALRTLPRYLHADSPLSPCTRALKASIVRIILCGNSAARAPPLFPSV
jgi:hypothetical protein